MLIRRDTHTYTYALFLSAERTQAWTIYDARRRWWQRAGCCARGARVRHKTAPRAPTPTPPRLKQRAHFLGDAGAVLASERERERESWMNLSLSLGGKGVFPVLVQGRTTSWLPPAPTQPRAADRPRQPSQAARSLSPSLFAYIRIYAYTYITALLCTLAAASASSPSKLTLSSCIRNRGAASYMYIHHLCWPRSTPRRCLMHRPALNLAINVDSFY